MLTNDAGRYTGRSNGISHDIRTSSQCRMPLPLICTQRPGAQLVGGALRIGGIVASVRFSPSTGCVCWQLAGCWPFVCWVALVSVRACFCFFVFFFFKQKTAYEILA